MDGAEGEEATGGTSIFNHRYLSVYLVQISEFAYTFDNISMVDHVNRLSISFFLFFFFFKINLICFLPCPQLS